MPISQLPALILAALSPSLIIRIVKILPKLLNLSDLLTSPAGGILREFLDIVNGVLETRFDTVFGVVPALLDIFGDFFGFANLDSQLVLSMWIR